MAYIYESIQPGIFSFTIPGVNKTVKLYHGAQVTVEQQLTGSYLRVLKLVKEVQTVEETPVVENKQQAKVADKITKVEEVAEVKTEELAVEVTDSLVASEPVEEVAETTTKNKRK